MKAFLLSFLLKINKPQIIVVFGHYGREEARMMIVAVLGRHMSVCQAPADRILEVLWQEAGGFLGVCAKVLGLSKAFFSVVVISGEPHEIGYQFCKKAAGIAGVAITPLTDIPSFSDMFSASPRDAAPYLRELKTLPVSCWLLLNYDDEAVRSLDERTNLRHTTYGVSSYADIYAAELGYHIEERDEEYMMFCELYGKIHTDGSMVPFRVSLAFGKRHIYAALAAVGCAARFNMNIVEAIEGMCGYAAPLGSGRIIRGVKRSVITDASTGATPFLVRELVEIGEALEKNRQKGRTFVALGDLAGFGQGEGVRDLHTALGEYIGRIAEELYVVGERVQFTAEAVGALIGEDHIHVCATAEEAGRSIQQALTKDDWVFVFGSPGLGMENVVRELRADISGQSIQKEIK